MNRLAEALGMDPVELRVRNVLHEGDLLCGYAAAERREHAPGRRAVRPGCRVAEK